MQRKQNVVAHAETTDQVEIRVFPVQKECLTNEIAHGLGFVRFDLLQIQDTFIQGARLAAHRDDVILHTEKSAQDLCFLGEPDTKCNAQFRVSHLL